MTTLRDGPHAAQFILTEANGQRSRDNIKLAAGQDILPGALLSGDNNAGYTAVSGAPSGNLALSIYGVKTEADPVMISAITRDAEVNRHAMAWTEGMDENAIGVAAAALAEQGIIVRGSHLPSPNEALPSPGSTGHGEAVGTTETADAAKPGM